MAEFSYEFIAREGWDVPFDFSIQDVFNNLKDGEVAYEVCEGFGFTRIHRNANECLLWFPSVSRLIPLDEVMLSKSLSKYQD